MSQTREGALKLRANIIGISVEQLIAFIEAGQKRCTRCRQWKSSSLFGSDKSRPDGLSSTCLSCRKEYYDKTYTPKINRKPYGPKPNPPRDGDKVQARSRINTLVRTGKIPKPNDLPCHDCGHVYGDDQKRHEYDHYLGYEGMNHYAVQSVCSACHRRRTKARGELVQQRDSEGKYTSRDNNG